MDYVSVAVHDHIGTVTINRPPVNAIDLQTYQEIAHAFKVIDEDEDIRVAVFRAEGQKAFIAGNDLNEFATMGPENAPERMATVRESFWAVYDCRVPVIGAINGPALGAGLGYAAVCDVLLAAEDATFALPEIDVGVMGGAKHLSRLVPQMVVRYMHYTGDALSARQMQSYGAVLKVVPQEQLMEAAFELAQRIASKSPIAIRMAEKALNRIEYMDLKEGYKLEQGLTEELSGSEDSKEAVRAFFEKRKPIFRGR